MPCPTDAKPALTAQLDAIARANTSVVRRALRQLGVPPAQLDDAVQDVFVVLVRRIEDFDASRNLKNWLWGIAKGVASGYRRTDRRRGRLVAALNQTVDRPSASARPGEVQARCGGVGRPTWAVPVPRDGRTVERAVAGREAAEILEDFLESLDQDKCAVFVLSEIEGRTGPEIAEQLGVNLNTIYARLRAVRRSFRAAMKGRTDPDMRPLFAGFMPAMPKPLAWATTAAVATALVMPLAATPELDSDEPRLVGYSLIPDAEPIAAAGQPTESKARRRGPVARSSAPELDADEPLEFVIIEDDEPSTQDTDTALAGQGMGRGRTHQPAAQQTDPMLNTIVLAAVLAAPASSSAPAPIDNDSDADSAARVGSDGVTTVYDFFDEELEGDILRDDGTVVLHRPRTRGPSLISIRGHFVPELMWLATDV